MPGAFQLNKIFFQSLPKGVIYGYLKTYYDC
jgi:hypothetical protein